MMFLTIISNIDDITAIQQKTTDPYLSSQERLYGIHNVVPPNIVMELIYQSWHFWQKSSHGPLTDLVDRNHEGIPPHGPPHDLYLPNQLLKVY